MMATQKKKPLPAQHRKIEPLTRKAEAATPPQLQLEVLQERMDHLATREETNAIIVQMDTTNARIDATNAQMHKLHGETMERMDVLQERVNQTATTVEVLQERVNQTATTVEVLQERTKQMATTVEVLQEHTKQIATTVEVLQERTEQTATTVEVLQERTKQMATKAEMYKLHGETMERFGKMDSDLKFMKWIGGTIWVAIIAGVAKIIFFPVA